MKRQFTTAFILAVMLSSVLYSITAATPPQGGTPTGNSDADSLRNQFVDNLLSRSSQAMNVPGESSLSQRTLDRLNWLMKDNNPNHDMRGTLKQNAQFLFGKLFEKGETNDVIDLWRDLSYLNGTKARLIVGIDASKSYSIADLQALATRHEARIVSTISAAGVEACVIELPLGSVTRFTREAFSLAWVSYVQPSMKVQAQLVPNDPDWSLQWGPQKIQADWAWNTTTGSPEILVAVVDSGIDYNHPDLAANYALGGYDWVNNDNDPMDDFGHGTHCAGIIAGVMNNGIGIAGMAQVRIMSEKVLDQYGGGWDFWIASGIINATDAGARIISMSLGGYGQSQLMYDAVKYAYEHGVLVIAAAGNDNVNWESIPAAYDEVIAVAATDQSDSKAWFSNWGDWIELAAPGVDIYSTLPYSIDPSGYAYKSGTSMACPHVSGLAALVWTMYPSATRDWVRMWLRSTADDLGAPGFDQYFGYGRINARSAVEQTPSAHDLAVTNFVTPRYVQPGESAYFNITVFNLGTNDEVGVTVQLLANGTPVVSSSIDSLISGFSSTVSLSWIPTASGVFNMTAYVVPVPGETSMQDNAMTKSVRALPSIVPNIMVVSDDDGIGVISGTSLREFESALSAAGYDYYVWVESEMGNPPLSFMLKFKLIIWTCGDHWAWAIDSADSESLQSYYAQGGNILLEGEDIGFDHDGDSLMLNVGHALYSVDNANASGLTVTDPEHPVVSGLPSSLTWKTTPIFPDGVTPTNGGAEVIRYTETSWTAVVVYDGFDTGGGSVVYYAFPLLNLQDSDAATLATNSVEWLLGVQYEHELTVSLQAPSTELAPDDSSLLSATVFNRGLNNEADVQFSLLINGTPVNSALIAELPSGASFMLDYLWTPTTTGIYNVSAYAVPVPDESVTTNNVKSKYVAVHYPLINPIPGQYANYVLDIYYNYNGSNQYAGTEYINLTYLAYVGPHLVLVSMWMKSPFGDVYTDYMTVDTMSRYVESGAWAGLWYPGWIETNINIGSTINLLQTTGTVVDSGVFLFGSYPIDCWKIDLSYDYQYQFLYDKSSGLWASMNASSDLMSEELRLVETNIPIVAPHEHELAAAVEAPSYLEPAEPSLVNATAHNIGLNAETGVVLSLFINEIQVDNITVDLGVGEIYTLSYFWTPMEAGIYNITAYVSPVEGEGTALNNVASRYVSVRYPLINPIPGQYANYATDLYYNYNGSIQFAGTGYFNMTYVGYVEPYHILVVVSMKSPSGGAYTDFMIVNTMDRYVESGMWAGSWYSGWIETNLNIGSTINLLQTTATVSDSKFALLDIFPIDCWKIDCILGYEYQFLFDKSSGLWISTNFSYDQMIEELRLVDTNVPIGTTLPHELGVTLDSPQYLMPGRSSLLNATVYNIGSSDETNSAISLIIDDTIVASKVIPTLQSGTSCTISYSWTPLTEGVHNVTAYAEPVEGEALLTNNNARMLVLVTTSTYWAKTYGGGNSDWANSIQQTADGGYIVAGVTDSFGLGGDVWVLKLSSTGSVVWQKTYGGAGYEEALSVQQTSDLGYVVAGYTYSFGADNSSCDVWVLRLDSAGSVVWQKTYGGSGDDWAMSIQQTSDGGYVVVGETYSFGAGGGDVWVLKLDSTGSVVWQKTYGGSDLDYAWSVQQTSDKGYIVAGGTYSFGAGDGDLWILKLDSTGSVTWQETYGGAGYDEAEWIRQTSDAGYIVAGFTGSFGAGSWDAWVLKLSSTGSVTWQKTFGGTGPEVANSAMETLDGGYIVAGWTNSFGAGGFDFWVLKLSSTGSVTWQKAYGGTADDEAFSVQQTFDGGYIVAGITRSFGAGDWDPWVVKLGINGYIVWNAWSGASTGTTYVMPIDSNAAVFSTSVTPADSDATVQDTNVTPQDTYAIVTVQAGSLVDETPPANIDDLHASSVTSTSVTLAWTAPGDDSWSGSATGYVVKYSTSGPITDANWITATVYCQSWTPQPGGSPEMQTISGLNTNTQYWFAIKAYDEVFNFGGCSNSPSATTDGNAPAQITDLVASNPTSNSITLTWTAPGDDGYLGDATGYVLKYSTSGEITSDNWGLATTYLQSWTPTRNGTTEIHVVSGLSSSTRYWFAIKAYDEVPNYGDVSNSPSARTRIFSTTPEFYEQYGFGIVTNGRNMVVTGLLSQPPDTGAPPKRMMPFVYFEMSGELPPGRHASVVFLFYNRTRVYELGLDERTLSLYTWDSVRSKWNIIPVRHVFINATCGLLIAHVKHFSYFAVFGYECKHCMHPCGFSPCFLFESLQEGIRNMAIIEGSWMHWKTYSPHSFDLT